MNTNNSDSGVLKTVIILTAIVTLITGVLNCTKEGLAIKKDLFPWVDPGPEPPKPKSDSTPEPDSMLKSGPDPKPKSGPKPSDVKLPRPPKLGGAWTFTMYSNVGQWTVKGNLNIEYTGNNNQTEIRGHLTTLSTHSFSDSIKAPSISGDVHGTFSNNQLKLMRDTGERNTIQCYDLIYQSNDIFSGRYHNEGYYNDNGTFQLKR